MARTGDMAGRERLLRPQVQNERVLVHQPDDILRRRGGKVCARARSS